MPNTEINIIQISAESRTGSERLRVLISNYYSFKYFPDSDWLKAHV